jgi:hypothetical protein
LNTSRPPHNGREPVQSAAGTVQPSSHICEASTSVHVGTFGSDGLRDIQNRVANTSAGHRTLARPKTVRLACTRQRARIAKPKLSKTCRVAAGGARKLHISGDEPQRVVRGCALAAERDWEVVAWHPLCGHHGDSRQRSVTYGRSASIARRFARALESLRLRTIQRLQPFVRVILPQGVEIEGVYEAACGIHPPRYWLYAFALWEGQRSHTIGMRWAPTEQGAKAMIASLARRIRP